MTDTQREAFEKWHADPSRQVYVECKVSAFKGWQAALASGAAVQEPVGEISSSFSDPDPGDKNPLVLYGVLARLRNRLPVGTKLYAAPVPRQAEAALARDEASVLTDEQHELLEAADDVLRNGHQHDVGGGDVFLGTCDSTERLQRAVDALRAILAASSPATKHCEYCDGTGDVHGIDGEWRGECTACDAASSAATVSDAASAETLKQKRAAYLEGYGSVGNTKFHVVNGWDAAVRAMLATNQAATTAGTQDERANK